MEGWHRDAVITFRPSLAQETLDVATSPASARVDPQQVRRFGGFEFDPQTGIISRNGSKTRLQGQPLQLLELLLRQPGAIVTREDIRQHLWPDGTVVEFEHSVNAAVKRLRAALEDDADHPTFIETIPRRGYRFIAPVEDGATPPIRRRTTRPGPRDRAATSQPAPARRHHSRRLSWFSLPHWRVGTRIPCVTG